MKKIFLLIILIIYTDFSRGQPEQAALDFFAKKILPEYLYRNNTLRYDGLIQADYLEFIGYQEHARSIVSYYYTYNYYDNYHNLDQGSKSYRTQEIELDSILAPLRRYRFTLISADSIVLNIPEGMRKKKKLKYKIRPSYGFGGFFYRRIWDPISQERYNVFVYPRIFYDNHYYICFNVRSNRNEGISCQYIFKITEDTVLVGWSVLIYGGT